MLVVDHDPLTAVELSRMLAQETGFEVQTCTSSEAAAEAVAASPPDAVIVGGRMLDVLGPLREADPDLEWLVMTSASDPAGDDLAASAGAGPMRHVVKPIDAADLLPKLVTHLDRRRVALRLNAALAELSKRDSALAASKRQVERATAQLELTHGELQTATERLVESEQLAAVGRVVTGIAYELSRQLALVGYAEAIKSRVADDTELVEFASIIVNAQKRLTSMVDEIRDFVAGEDENLEREPADVASIVEEALAIIGYDRDVREREIVRKVKAHPLARLHRQKFCQVVINLVSNAVLATEPGDVIEVHVDIDPAEGVAVVTVLDQGVGMAADVLQRLGEPFFTTRGDRGSGLGVGICMSIVEDHGGQLTFKSKEGAGTAARVTVPLLEAAS